ncbi:restriction endonuclease subunit S [Legionella pneumophila serogroup 1]|nr:restriction endonuclease subunit S [Legionella pneumophila]
MIDNEETNDSWTPKSYPIPEHWLYTELEDIFKNLSLTNNKLAQKNYDANGIFPVIDQGMSEIGGYSNDANKLIKINRPAIVFGDHTKCLKYINFPFIPGADGIKVLVPRNPIDPKYAFYACKSMHLPDRGYSRHYSFLKKCNFPLAPLNEQKRIVAKIEELFSELDNGIAALKTARTQLKVYRQALLKHAFAGKLTAKWREENADKLETPEQLLARIQKERDARYQEQLEDWKAAIKEWEAKGKEGKKPGKPKEPIAPILYKSNFDIPNYWVTSNLGLIADVSGGLTKNQKRNSLPVKMKYLRVANVYADKLLLDNVEEIGVTHAEAKKVLLIKNDLLVVEGNGSVEQIGRVALWDASKPGCGHQNHLIRVRLDNPDYARFVLLFLLSPVGRDLIVKEASSTSGLHTLSISKISNLQIPIVTLSEAKLLINIVDEKIALAAKLEEDIQTELKRADTLRQSILKQAYSGKLVLQDLNDEPAAELLARIKADKEQQKTPSKKSTYKPNRKKVREEV